jgi:hypothetical protein
MSANQFRSQSSGTWCVVYVGSPYGEGESGEIVSRHRSEEAAEEARSRLQNNPKYYGQNTIVRRQVRS